MKGKKFDDLVRLNPYRSVKHRLPWLIIGLGGGLFGSRIINNFQQLLSTNLILASFIPLIVYMADAVGTQLEAFTIREIDKYKQLNFNKYFARQIKAVVLIGIVTSILTFVVSFFIYGVFRVSIVLSVSLFAAIMSSLFTGTVVPYYFSVMKQDPANTSGPVATIIQDLVSITIYFVLASSLLS